MEDTTPDPRDLEHVQVGTKLRDAAVDPRPDDYLPPTNAGQANPHGPLVVAPEIHGSGPAPLTPGVVTEERETKAAELSLVDGKPAGDVVEALAGDNTGPLNLSDRSSGEFADTGVAPSDGAVTPDKPAKKSTRRRKSADA